MKTLVRKATAGACALALMIGGAGIAHADDIANNLDASIDAAAETMNLTAGGVTGTTTLRVITANGDGKNGCNLTGSTTLTVDVTSSNAEAATVSPSSVTFTSCSETKALTVTPLAPGTTTVSLSQTSNSTEGTFNLAPATFSVNVAAASVTDRVAPVLSGVPEDQTVEATGPSGAIVSWTGPTAEDAIDGTLPVVCDPASGTTFALGATTVTCSATDAAGNRATDTFIVTVEDSTGPVLDLPDDITVEATGPDGATVSWPALTAEDTVDGSVPVTCDPASGTTFALGGVPVACSATDAAGNTTTETFTVTVQDTTGPVLVLPDDITIEATGPDGATVTWADPTAHDTVDGSVPVPCDPASGTTFALGAVPVTCSATDAAGNTTTNTFDVTVQDTTAPVLTVPAGVTAEATAASGATVSYAAPTATDLVDGTLTVTCDKASGATFPLGTTTVSCTATDKAGNIGRSSFDVTVADTTAPTLSAVSDQSATATSASGAIVSYTAPTATDLVDGTVTVTCDKASGDTFALGTTTVTCTATDKAGNTGTRSFGVTVQYASTGILQPINTDATKPRSGFKLNSTIPVKVQLTGASAQVTDAQLTIKVTKIGGLSGETVEMEPVVLTASHTGGTLRYSDGQYIYNLSAKSLGTGQFTVEVLSGTHRLASATISIIK